VLQILRDTPEGLTAAELAKALQMDKQQVQTAVRNVVALHLVEAPRDAYAPKNYRRSRYVHIAHTRTVATPRMVSWKDGGTYTGPDWSSACSRPGCLDHEQYDSRRADGMVPYHGRRAT
jgi:hypothetical protein